MATPPPGLEDFGPIQVLTNGGSGEWMVLPPIKLYTISFIIKSGKVTPVDLDPARLLTRGRTSIRYYLAIRNGASGRECKSKVSDCAWSTEV